MDGEWRPKFITTLPLVIPLLVARLFFQESLASTPISSRLAKDSSHVRQWSREILIQRLQISLQTCQDLVNLPQRYHSFCSRCPSVSATRRLRRSTRFAFCHRSLPLQRSIHRKLICRVGRNDRSAVDGYDESRECRKWYFFAHSISCSPVQPLA